jgi:hypothetical protein
MNLGFPQRMQSGDLFVLCQRNVSHPTRSNGSNDVRPAGAMLWATSPRERAGKWVGSKSSYYGQLR